MINNCPAHPQINNLKLIKLFYPPPTEHNFSTTYLKNVVLKIIESAKKKKTLPKIFLLLGMHMLLAACDAVTMETVVNYFQKSKTSSES